MPLYIDLAGLYARFTEDEINQVADTDRTGTPDPALISRACRDATDEIDAALRVRYVVPLKAPVPPLIVRIAAVLAREALYTDKPPEVVVDQAKWARKTLSLLASGEMLLEALLAETSPLGGDAQIESGREQSPFASPFVRRRGRA
jgi:phage gp36-like protein